MAPRNRLNLDIRKSKLLAAFKVQEARSTDVNNTTSLKANAQKNQDCESIIDGHKNHDEVFCEPAKILNSLVSDKKLLAQAMYHGSDENPSKKGGRPRTVKDDAFVFGTGSMYASAAHFLFNRVVIEEGTFRGRSGKVKAVKSVLNETIWELVGQCKESEKKRKRQKKTLHMTHSPNVPRLLKMAIGVLN